MKILLVSPYPPLRDGIANYAAQMASGLRDEGHQVTVLSSQPSAAKWHDDLRTMAGVGADNPESTGFDRVIVQFYPELFFSTVRGPSSIDNGYVPRFSFAWPAVSRCLHTRPLRRQARAGVCGQGYGEHSGVSRNRWSFTRKPNNWSSHGSWAYP